MIRNAHYFCDGEHGLIKPCEKGKKWWRETALCAAWAQPIQPDLRRVSRPPRSRTFPKHPPGPAQLLYIHRRTRVKRKKRPRRCRERLSDSRRNRRIETRRRLLGGRIVEATKGTAPDFLSCSVYQGISMIVARREFVTARKNLSNFRFYSVGYVAHVWSDGFKRHLDFMCLFRKIWTKVNNIRPVVCHPIIVMMPLRVKIIALSLK